MYADNHGNIFYLYNGASSEAMQSFDWLKPVMAAPPNQSGNGYHALTNSRRSPIQSRTSPELQLDPIQDDSGWQPRGREFSSLHVGEPDNARARISRRILSTKPMFTFDEWAHAGFDTQVITAEELLPDLLAKVDKTGNEKLAPIAAALRGWDRKSAIDSVPMTVYMTWFEKVKGTAVMPAKRRRTEIRLSC